MRRQTTWCLISMIVIGTACGQQPGRDSIAGAPVDSAAPMTTATTQVTTSAVDRGSAPQAASMAELAVLLPDVRHLEASSGPPIKLAGGVTVSSAAAGPGGIGGPCSVLETVAGEQSWACPSAELPDGFVHVYYVPADGSGPFFVVEVGAEVEIQGDGYCTVAMTDSHPGEVRIAACDLAGHRGAFSVTLFGFSEERFTTSISPPAGAPTHPLIAEL